MLNTISFVHTMVCRHTQVNVNYGMCNSSREPPSFLPVAIMHELQGSEGAVLLSGNWHVGRGDHLPGAFISDPQVLE